MANCNEVFSFKRGGNAVYDQKRFAEAALNASRASIQELRTCVDQMPIDQYIDCVPHSLILLDTLYSKFYLFDKHRFPVSALKPYRLFRQITWFMARELDPGNKRKSIDWKLTAPRIRNLLRLTESVCPALRSRLDTEKQEIDKSLEGLGLHGLINCGDRTLIEVGEAVKHELADHGRRLRTLHQQLEKLLQKLPKDESTFSINDPQGPVPSKSSHQRLMNLRLADVKRRLDRNEYMLQMVRSSLYNAELQSLERILQKRIRYDQEILGQFSFLIRRNAAYGLSSDNPVVSHVLVLFSKAYNRLLMLAPATTSAAGNGGGAGDDSGVGEDEERTSPGVDSGDSPIDSVSETSIVKQIEQSKLRESGVSSLSSNDIPLQALQQTLDRNRLIVDNQADEELDEPPRRSEEHRRSKRFFSKVAGRRNDNNGFVIGRYLSSIDLRPKPADQAVSKRRQRSRDFSPSPCFARCRGLNGSNLLEVSRIYSSMPSLDPATQLCGSSAAFTVFAKPPVQQPPSNTYYGQPVITIGTNGETAESCRLKGEVTHLRASLQSANEKLKKKQQQLSDMCRMLLNGDKCNIASANAICANGSEQVDLIMHYETLYSRGRIETMFELERTTELRGAEELQLKILLSVVVLSFRFTQQELSKAKDAVWSALRESRSWREIERISDSDPQVDFVRSLNQYLFWKAGRDGYASTSKAVSEQIWQTLYDFSSLKKCNHFKTFISDCVSTAWRLTVCRQAYNIEFEATQFNAERHRRYHLADFQSTKIKHFVWPALINLVSQECVSRGVVIT